MGLEGEFKTKGREEIGGTQDGSGRNLQRKVRRKTWRGRRNLKWQGWRE